MQPLGKCLVEGFDDQRRLPGAGNARDAGQDPEGNSDIDVLQIVGPGADNFQPALTGTPLTGDHNLPFAREVLAGQRPLCRNDLRGSSLSNHLATMHTGRRAHIDNMVRRPNRLFVMLDHQHRVSEVTQPLQSSQQPLIIPLMQADGRLIENIQNPHQ